MPSEELARLKGIEAAERVCHFELVEAWEKRG